MTDYTYFPLNQVEAAGYDDLLDLLEDDDLLAATGILCFQRDESWSSRPLYYVLARDELFHAKEAASSEIRGLARDDLFHLLNIHEGTEAEKVPVGLEPDRRAVAFDAAGSLAGVWIESQAVPEGEESGGEGTRTGAKLLGDEEGPIEAPATRNGEPHEEVAANGGGDEERRSDEESAKDPFFRRTPHMDLSADEPLQRGQDFQVLVYLDTAEARPGETVREVLIADLPEDLETLDIELMLVGSDHFEVMSESIKTLVLHRDDERSEDLPFDVHVRDDAPLDQPASLTAYMTYNHRPSGRVQRAVTVAGATPPVPAEDEPAPVAPDQFATDAKALPADVTVDVVATPDNDGRKFLVTVRTTLVDDFAMTKPEPWNFPEQTDEMVSAMMSEFAREGASPEDRQDSLIGAGNQLWELAPKCFKDLFCRLVRENNPPRTIYITSAEPHIPWELMRPKCVLEDGSEQEREALGVESMVGRYVDPGHRSPKQNDSIDASYIMAGTKYRRQKRLQKAEDEAKWVADRFGGTIVTPAQRTQLDKMLKERAVGLLHFVAHGRSAPNAPQQLVLGDDKVFNSLQVSAMRGLKAACEKQAPVVFLNACDVGRQAPSLVGAGGFAAEFIKAGARCVVAPLWSVKDTVAHEVAIEFYQAALDEPSRPFADILKDIRAKSYSAGGAEDTYAAYCFYGDPLTSLAPPE
jgi:CHAT domain-containing protein